MDQTFAERRTSHDSHELVELGELTPHDRGLCAINLHVDGFIDEANTPVAESEVAAPGMVAAKVAQSVWSTLPTWCLIRDLGKIHARVRYRGLIERFTVANPSPFHQADPIQKGSISAAQILRKVDSIDTRNCRMVPTDRRIFDWKVIARAPPNRQRLFVRLDAPLSAASGFEAGAGN